MNDLHSRHDLVTYIQIEKRSRAIIKLSYPKTAH
jgi:hypothetical protein